MGHCSVHLVGTLDTSLVGSVLSGEEGLSRFIKFQLSDFAVRWVDWHLNGVATSLVPDDLLNVDAPSSSVNGDNLTVGTLSSVLGASSENLHGVALSHWN